MTMQDNNADAAALTTTSGRPIKFTPERLEQIKNLVERGMSREQIAETIGVTLGSLQVTCSRLGISLRRPRLLGIVPRLNGSVAPPREVKMTGTNGRHDMINFSLHFEYRGSERTVPIPLSTETIQALALEACIRDMTMSELLAQLITQALQKE